MKILRYFIILLATIICGSIYAQRSQHELKQLMRERGEFYFNLTIQHPSEIQAINKLCSVDKTNGATVICYANQKQFDNLIKQGYQPNLLVPPSMLDEVAMWDGSNRTTYDWDSYPTYNAYEAMMFEFQNNHPDRCEIITLGTLPSGRKILIANLNNGTGDGKPKFLYTSTIHGDETTGWIMMLRLIDYLLENPDDPEVQNVINNIDLFICPNSNPDGTYHNGNNTVYGATRENANGVDMNRNYPDPNGGLHPDGEEYQLETQWFMQFAQDIPFVMGANYHGGAEVMNYPWDNTYTLHPDDAWWQMVCHEYADLTHQINPNYMSDFYGGIINGAQWYMIGGGRQDYMNGYAQCREVTIECSNTKLPPGNQLPNFWNYNKNSLFAYMNQSLYGIHGTVTDKDNGQPLVANVTIASHDNEFSFVKSHLPAGDYHRPIKGGTYTLTFTASGYYTHEETITIDDYETITLNVQLEAGEGIIPDFNANMPNVGIGESVNFTDQTWGANLVSWEWTFEGGEPSTSNLQNPNGITYNEIGSFDVSLTVTNNQGQTETLTKHNYINVSEMYYMQDGTFETCDAMFYDDGGPYGNYSDRKDYTITFLPNIQGGMIEAIFEEFAIENSYDFLYIYDGSSTNAPSIGQYTGTNSPNIVAATNPEGALTFHFSSDYSMNQSGWAARIHCTGIAFNPIELEVFADPEVIDEGDSAQLSVYATGGDGNYTYHWEPEETLDNPTIAFPIAKPVEQETTYKVTVTDGEGNSESGEITINIRNWSVAENCNFWKIYPNPNNGIFSIETIGEFSYSIFNCIGQRILSGNVNGKTQIDGTNLKQGVYFLYLNDEYGNKIEKIVIE